ncbi:MAG TPA: tetrahydrofolate dehydrogenase/cyclohydrolase catalytic domain-containing protein [Trueperaceae bacterium]|nr:tetrahydrofolate dehydrogenase/cyclohydrolase catalytic domain-containing protein [Trueperaceae bacterium]
MTAIRLDGKVVSSAVADALVTRVAALPFTPKLVFVRVGEDPASAYYVRSKERMARRVGVVSETHVLPDATGQAELEQIIRDLNADGEVDGILVQLPLPGHIDSQAVLDLIDPDKDVDGLHPVNVGRLWTGRPALAPATPRGLVALLDHYQVPIEGRHAVIVGRSNLVGRPAAALFQHRNATVTMAHSRTRDLADVVRQGDIVVAAAGRARMITRDMVKPGAAVLDVGMTREGEAGIVGDVSKDVAEVAGYLTPMPGGTGLMTVAMVIDTTVEAARRRRGSG